MSRTIELVFSLLLVGIIIFKCKDSLKKNTKIWYLVVGIASGLVFLGMTFFVLNYQNLPRGIYNVWYLFPYRLIAGGFLGTAIWSYVMVASSIPNENTRKHVMSIRTELSIMGTMISLPQALVYTIFRLPSIMSTSPLYFGLGILLLIIPILLIILGYTSLAGPKRRLGMKKWKKIQKLAYPYYFLMFLEIIVITVMRGMYRTPGTLEFYATWLRVAIYVIIYCGYIVLKIRRRREKSKQ